VGDAFRFDHILQREDHKENARRDFGTDGEKSRSDVEKPRGNVEESRSDVEESRGHAGEPKSDVKEPRNDVEEPRESGQRSRDNDFGIPKGVWISKLEEMRNSE
jgi:hypothetical protein